MARRVLTRRCPLPQRHSPTRRAVSRVMRGFLVSLFRTRSLPNNNANNKKSIIASWQLAQTSINAMSLLFSMNGLAVQTTSPWLCVCWMHVCRVHTMLLLLPHACSHHRPSHSAFAAPHWRVHPHHASPPDSRPAAAFAVWSWQAGDCSHCIHASISCCAVH
ncbi:hypothetical protein BC831DRAFT_441432 [Entophlyctis helioformis]|nr:hypothetical protein BC831DRAFT_441432 [Entophlyctis helioformis]